MCAATNTPTPGAGMDPHLIPLAATITGLEREVATLGWDRAPQLYILVSTRKLLDTTPGMDPTLVAQLEELLAEVPDHITAIAQEDLPQADLSQLLAHIVFPPEVDGVAVSMERVVLPPDVEAQAPQSEPERTEYYMNHERRDDVRMVTGVLRSGHNWSALRIRSKDSDDMVVTGEDRVPELIEALSGTLDEASAEDLIDPAEVFGPPADA